MIHKKILYGLVLALLLAASVIMSGCTSAGDGKAAITDPAVKVLTLDDLRKFPSVTGHGYSVSTTGIRFGPYVCTGVDLKDIISDMGGMGPGDRIWISAPDGYLWVFDAEQVTGKGFVTFNTDLKEIPSPPLRIILMYEQDNKAVSYNDGGPVRVAIISEEPGVITEGSAWVKWVNRIEIKRK
jgi:hypothetical protein